MKKKTTVRIPWSIHFCVKTEIKGRLGSSHSSYLLIKKDGRRKVRRLHETLGGALKEIGI